MRYIADGLIPLLFGMGLMVAGLLMTYCVHRCMVFLTGKGEDAPLQLVLGTAQAMAIVAIWLLLGAALINGVDTIVPLIR